MFTTYSFHIDRYQILTEYIAYENIPRWGFEMFWGSARNYYSVVSSCTTIQMDLLALGLDLY